MLQFSKNKAKSSLSIFLRSGILIASAIFQVDQITYSEIDWSDITYTDIYWQQNHRTLKLLLPRVAEANNWSLEDINKAKILISNGSIESKDLVAASIMKYDIDKLVLVKQKSLSDKKEDKQWLIDNQMLATLAFGAGFGGSTTTPTAIGSAGAGYTAVPIARWDTPIYDLKTGTFTIGVAAFHYNGIEKVEFSLNGGAWESCTSMSLNSETGVWVYAASVDTSTITPDGSYEIRAKITPNTRGQCVVLQGALGTSYSTNRRGRHGFWFAANNGGSLINTIKYVSTSGNNITGDGSSGNPYATLERAALALNGPGRIIVKTAGNYDFGDGTASTITITDRWVVIEPDTGLSDTDVVIINADTAGIGSTHVKLKNLKLGAVLTIKARNIFFENVTNDPNAYSTSDALITTTFSYYIAAVNCESTRCRNGMRSISFINNCNFHDMTGAPLGSTGCTFNTLVTDYNNSVTAFHGDVAHWFNVSTTDDDNADYNSLIYGCESYRWNNPGIFLEVQYIGGVVADGPYMNNYAFINIHMSADGTLSHGSTYNNSTNWCDSDHALYWYWTAPEQNLSFKQIYGTPVLTLTNCSILGCILYGMNESSTSFTGSTYPFAQYNHVRTGTTFGTDCTSGANVGFAASGIGVQSGYYLDPNSPATNRISSTPYVPVGISGFIRVTGGNIGAFAEKELYSSPPYNSIAQKPTNIGWRKYCWLPSTGLSLARYATHLWPIHENSGSVTRDIVNNYHLIEITGQSSAWVTSPGGTALSNPVYKCTTGIVGYFTRPSFPFTLMAVYIAPDIGSAGGQLIGYDVSNSNSLATRMSVSSGFLGCVDNSSSEAAVAIYDSSDGNMYVAFATFVSSTNRNAYLFKNGILLASGRNTNSNGGTLAPNQITLGFQETTGPTYNTRFIDEILMAAEFGVGATVEQMTAAASDPFGIITKPVSLTIEYPSGIILSSYSFETISALNTNEITLTINNNTSGSITGISPSLSTNDFSLITQPTGTLPAYTSNTFTLRANTLSNGTKTDTLTIISSAYDSPTSLTLDSFVSDVVVIVPANNFLKYLFERSSTVNAETTEVYGAAYPSGMSIGTIDYNTRVFTCYEGTFGAFPTLNSANTGLAITNPYILAKIPNAKQNGMCLVEGYPSGGVTGYLTHVHLPAISSSIIANFPSGTHLTHTGLITLDYETWYPVWVSGHTTSSNYEQIWRVYYSGIYGNQSEANYRSTYLNIAIPMASGSIARVKEMMPLAQVSYFGLPRTWIYQLTFPSNYLMTSGTLQAEHNNIDWLFSQLHVLSPELYPLVGKATEDNRLFADTENGKIRMSTHNRYYTNFITEINRVATRHNKIWYAWLDPLFHPGVTAYGNTPCDPLTQSCIINLSRVGGCSGYYIWTAAPTVLGVDIPTMNSGLSYINPLIYSMKLKTSGLQWPTGNYSALWGLWLPS